MFNKITVLGAVSPGSFPGYGSMSNIAQLLIIITMRIGEFESKRTGEVKDVCPDALQNDWANLKGMMSKATTVQEYNELRKRAKKLVPFKLINRLDASGFIATLNLKNEKEL